MAQSTYVPWWDKSAITTVTITPARANTWARCPLRRNARVEEDDGDRLSIWRHRYVRALIHTYSTVLIAGERSTIDAIIAAVPLPDIPGDDGDDATLTMDLARASLSGYRTILDATGAGPILDVGRTVRTPGRSIAGRPDCAIILAGRFDVVAVRNDRRTGEHGGRCAPGDAIVCIDIAQNVPEADLGDRPASYVYDHLARFAYGIHEVEITSAAPGIGRWSSAILTEAQREAGEHLCRAMVMAAHETAHRARTDGYSEDRAIARS